MRSPGLVVRNVAAIVLTPAGPRSQGRSLTVEQARALLPAADGHPLEAAFIVALTCGLRPGELLGLPWQDVDLDQALPGRPSRRRGLLSAAACWGGRGTRRPIPAECLKRVGVYPNPAALLRLAGAVLVEAHDERQVSDRRYLSEGSMALLQPAPDRSRRWRNQP